MLLSAKVTLIDRTTFPDPSAAAHDLNKTIDAEFEDLAYMRLAPEAQNVWRPDPVLERYYQETGILFAGMEEPGQKIIDDYDRLTGSLPAELLRLKLAQTRLGDIFRGGDVSLLESCTWIPQAGSGEADNALRDAIQASIDLGVKYEVATGETRTSG